MAGIRSVVTQIREPNGRTTTITYRETTMIGSSNEPSRIQSVNRSDGLQLKYVYALNTVPDVNTQKLWRRPQSIIAINNAVEYCDPAADSCSLSETWPTASYSWGTPPSGVGDTLTVTDASGSATRYTTDIYGRVIAIKPTTSSTDRISYEYCSRTFPWTCYINYADGTSEQFMDLTIKSTKDGQIWNYWFTPNIAGHYFEYKST